LKNTQSHRNKHTLYVNPYIWPYIPTASFWLCRPCVCVWLQKNVEKLQKNSTHKPVWFCFPFPCDHRYELCGRGTWSTSRFCLCGAANPPLCDLLAADGIMPLSASRFFTSRFRMWWTDQISVFYFRIRFENFLRFWSCFLSIIFMNEKISEVIRNLINISEIWSFYFWNSYVRRDHIAKSQVIAGISSGGWIWFR